MIGDMVTETEDMETEMDDLGTGMVDMVIEREKSATETITRKMTRTGTVIVGLIELNLPEVQTPRMETG